jgi:SAM-dependent methyltransferase
MTPLTFKDHFSGQSQTYQKYRPNYPRELFAWFAAHTPARELAVDVGTGNGQAAVGLADFFGTVIATDASAAQLALAEPHPRVSYRREPAERISVPDRSADLVVAAQAAHWFGWPAFVAEVRRVLRPGGLLAIWSYGLFVADPAVDRLIAEFSRVVVGPFWPRERRHVEEAYRDLPLPFPECSVPPFEMRADWDCDAALGYLASWSAVRRCRELSGRDPLALFAPLLAKTWGVNPRPVRWTLQLKCGRA